MAANLGPERNGIAQNEKLAEKWPSEGPKAIWQRDAGTGFSGIAVADGIAVLFHRLDNDEVVEAMNAKTGEVLWKSVYKSTFVPSYTSDDGPRAVPCIQAGHVVTYGAMGILKVFNLKTGKVLWTRDSLADYGPSRPSRGEPPEGFFGIGNSPLVLDGRVLVNVGGYENGAGLVAFSLETGKTLWKATDARASYSSPIPATVNGAAHTVFAARLRVISIDPQTGKTRFEFPFGQPGPNVTAATPVVMNDHLFITASYNFGAVFAQISESGVKELWRSDEILSSQYTTPIAHKGKLIGIHGRQDVGASHLRCIDPMSQEILWEEDNIGYATLLAADGKLLILKTDGSWFSLGSARKNMTSWRERKFFPVQRVPFLHSQTDNSSSGTARR